MAPPLSAVDVETFARTALRFAAKRRALPPEAAETLSGDIVRRLSAAAANRADPVPDDSLDAFCAALVQPGPDAAMAFLRARQAEGATHPELYLGYIAAAARALGARWDDNRLSLTEVTIGTGHLYALMRALRTEARPARPAPTGRRQALFATVPGEDHSIGITIAADLFREAGWDIDLQLATDHDGLVARAERLHPCVIGLSLSAEARLLALARLVVALRLALPGAVIGVAPAAALDPAGLDALLDIDLVLGDAETARAELERRLAALS